MMGYETQRITKSLQAVGLASVFFLAAATGGVSGQTTGGLHEPEKTPPSKAIPPAEVADRSSEVTNFLIALSEKFADSPEIKKIEQLLPEAGRQIDLDSTDTSVILAEQPPLAILEEQRVLWQRRHLQMSNWLTLLTQRAVALQDSLDRLSQMKAIWLQTRDAAKDGKAPGVVLQQIEATLAAIAAAQRPLKNREEVLLRLQADLGEKLARCSAVLAKILKVRKSAVHGIATRESLPVWNPDLWGRARTTLPYRFREVAHDFWTGIREYWLDPSRGMPLHGALLLTLTMATCAAQRKKRHWKDSGVGVSSAVKVFDRPYSAALLVVLLIATAVNSPAPPYVKDVFSALALAPMIRLVRPAIDPRLAPGISAVVILYVVELLRQTFGGAPLIEQALLILESLTAIAVLGRLLSGSSLQYAFGQNQEGLNARFILLMVKVLLVCLSVGCIAAALGFNRVARLIAPPIISGSVLAMALYAYVRVAGGTAVILLRTRILQRLQMVRNHGDRLEGWIYRLLVWTAIIFWANRSLAYIGMLDPVLSAGSAILDLRLARGSVSVSIGDILAFGLTVLASFLLSGFIRFVLREEVYPRKGIARGLSYAYSRLVHYIILATGFLMGLGVLGMDLTNVSVMAGAFGVGIGFGLQNVVNNFVCGLILLFERPVHVGDIVEVGDLQGEVRHIGIRASTVRVLQGADIIVPNAQFITASVTNWTFSDQLRRIDLPVGVNYGAAPQAVIELLEKTAQANSAVLQNPPPVCLFTGYGDSSINFELRAWTNQYRCWPAIRSELASAVYDAVHAAGLAFPFPQREVRVLGDQTIRKADGPLAADRTALSIKEN